MKEQLMLLTMLFAVLAFLRHTGNGFGWALASAVSPLNNRSWVANLYERVKIVFEKDAAEMVKEIKEEFKGGLETFKGEVKKWVDEAKEAAGKKASPDDLEGMKKDLEAKSQKMQEQLDELEKKANRLKEDEAPKGKGLLDQVEEQVVALKNSKPGALKELWEQKGRGGKELNIDLKAVSNMTTGYGLIGTNANLLRAFEMEPGIAKDPTTPLFVRDIISVGATDSHTIFWNERTLIEGGAGQVAEAAKFPQISTKYEKKSATSKKTAAYAKLTEEMIEDVTYIVSEIQDEIVNGPNSILVQVENQLLTGDGTGENHKGLFPYATAFAVPTGFETIANPNSYDAIRAAILGVVKNNFMPTQILLNPSDALNMELTKDGNGNYIVPPFLGPNGKVIAGLRIVESNRVAEDSFLVGEFSRAKLFIKRPLTLKFFDQNEDDAVYDMQTVTGSIRAIFRVKGPDTKAFVKGSLTGVKNMIKTV